MNHWDLQAKKHGTSYEASWEDELAINLEIDAISRHLNPGERVLDVGCGNGYSTRQHKNVEIVGVDSSHEMIEAARKMGGEFLFADARELQFHDKSFDVVYTTRCLINLPTWEDQKQAISECIRVARRKVILSEAFWEPLQKLNAIRQICGLEPLVEHDFNRYLKLSKLRAFVKCEVEDFSGVYYFGSRVLRELVTDHRQWAGYSNPINTDFYNMQQKYIGGGFGVQQLATIQL